MILILYDHDVFEEPFAKIVFLVRRLDLRFSYIMLKSGLGKDESYKPFSNNITLKLQQDKNVLKVLRRGNL